MKSSLGTKVLALLVALVGAVGVLVAVVLYFQFSGRIGGEVEQLLTRQLSAVVEVAAQKLDGDKVREVYRSHSFDDENYRTVQAALRGVRSSFRMSTDLYTLHREGERTRFGITCKDDPLLGDGYDLNPAMRQAFDGTGVTTSGVYHDKSGWWISAYAPVRDAAGNVVALVEADHQLDPYVNETRARVVRGAALALVLAGVFVALVGSVLVRRMVGPLAKLRKGAEQLAGGQFEGLELDVRARDEVGQLADALAKVAAAMKRLTQRVEELERRDRGTTS